MQVLKQNRQHLQSLYIKYIYMSINETWHLNTEMKSEIRCKLFAVMIILPFNKLKYCNERKKFYLGRDLVLLSLLL